MVIEFPFDDGVCHIVVPVSEVTFRVVCPIWIRKQRTAGPLGVRLSFVPYFDVQDLSAPNQIKSSNFTYLFCNMEWKKRFRYVPGTERI